MIWLWLVAAVALWVPATRMVIDYVSDGGESEIDTTDVMSAAAFGAFLAAIWPLTAAGLALRPLATRVAARVNAGAYTDDDD